MTTARPPALIEVADALQSAMVPAIFGANRVLAWWRAPDHASLGFQGDALSIERRALLDPMLDNRGHRLDVTLQQALGFDAEIEYRHGRAVGVTGGLGQRLDSGRAHVGQVLDDLLADAVRARLGLQEVAVALLPNEGAPWNPGDRTTPYYNARTQRILAGSPPAAMITVETRDEGSRPGVDFVSMAPRIESTSAAAVGLADRPFLVTHTIGIGRRGASLAAVADRWKQNQGILYPSMAVGQLPGATFGTVVMVVDPLIALAGLRPYRARGRWPVTVYNTDVWTETTTAFRGAAAAELFDQLTGRWSPSIYGQPHMYVLGPPLAEGGGPGDGRQLHDTALLIAALNQRARNWPRGLTAAEIEERASRLTAARYPYLEAKANGVVTMRSLVACAFPSSSGASVRAFLKRAGFTGELLPIPVARADTEVLEAASDHLALYRYSWAVHDAVLAWATATNRIHDLRVP